MAEDQAVAELERFLTDRADHLLRAAMLLTGSREAGQDLLQAALERLLWHWPTLDGDPEAYLRRTLYNLATDGYRRAGRLQRKLLLLRAEARPAADRAAQVDLRDALVRLLLQLPPRRGQGDRACLGQRPGNHPGHREADHRPAGPGRRKGRA